jgi:hypothetical protein
MCVSILDSAGAIRAMLLLVDQANPSRRRCECNPDSRSVDARARVAVLGDPGALARQPVHEYKRSIVSLVLRAQLPKAKTRGRCGRVVFLHSADLLGYCQPDEVVQRCAFRFCHQSSLLAEVVRQPENKAPFSIYKVSHFKSPSLAREPR